MTLFYFDTFDGNQEFLDFEGVHCLNRAAARREAGAALADMAHDALPDGQLRKFTVKIRDGHGEWFVATLRYHGRETRS